MTRTTETLNGRLTTLVEEIVSRGLTLEQARREFERQFIVTSLRQHEGSIGRCADSLGMHRNTLRNKLSTLGIHQRDYSARRQSRRH